MSYHTCIPCQLWIWECVTDLSNCVTISDGNCGSDLSNCLPG